MVAQRPIRDAIAEVAVPARSTIVIADDHTLVREGMKMLVSAILTEVDFVEASDAESLLQAAQDPAVRLALVDLDMPGMQGGFRLIELSRRCPQVAVVAISALTSFDLVRRITRIHTVHAFLPKSSDAPTIHQAIEAAMQGRRWSPATNTTSGTQTTLLTPRQQEICALLRQGMSNKMIAGTLGISEGTVKNHLSEIFRVLNATNRTQVAQFDL